VLGKNVRDSKGGEVGGDERRGGMMRRAGVVERQCERFLRALAYGERTPVKEEGATFTTSSRQIDGERYFHRQ
jgi:hypothetical protein